MLIKLPAFHNKLVADLTAHNQQDDLRPFYIIQHAEVADTQLELSKWVGAQPLDGLR